MQTHAKRRLLIFAGSLLLATSGCVNPTSIPPANEDKPPVIGILATSVGPGPGGLYPAIANSEGPTSSQAISVFPANGRFKFTGRASNPGGVKSLSISVTRAGVELVSASAAGSQGSDGTVPDSLNLSGNGTAPFEFSLSSGQVVVSADATNFNDMSTRFVVTFVVAADPVVNLTSTAVCNGGNGVVVNVTVNDPFPEASISATWYREEVTTHGQVKTPPVRIALHPNLENTWTSGPEQFFPVNASAHLHGTLQDIYVEVAGKDLYERPLSARIHTGLTSITPGTCVPMGPA